jgi:hypothetical protein
MAIALDTNPPDARPDARRLCTVYELGTKRDFLRTVHEAARKGLTYAISFEEVRARLGLREDAADRARDFWVREGVLRCFPAGHLALTKVGVRRAEWLEQVGWSLADL